MPLTTMQDLIVRSRTVRRYAQQEPIGRETLLALANLGRLSPSGGNLQALKYVLAHEPATNAAIFPCLAWAGYLKGWGGPQEGERPAGYIVMLGDTTLGKEFRWDAGIAAQSIMLGATELGLGCCMIGSVQHKKLRETLRLPERYEILLVLALGRPREQVFLEPVKDGDIKYWRDAGGGHHVPKRALEEVVLGFS